MYKPKFKIIIKNKSFFPDRLVCLGSQFIVIVNHFREILKPHTWYGANVKVLGELSKECELNSFNLKKIGNDKRLIKLCDCVEQFLEGVFFAIDDKYSDQTISNIEVDTEDEEYRSLDINGVLIEIRTFDTSFFELYSENEKFLEKLSKIFNVKIEKFSFTS